MKFRLWILAFMLLLLPGQAFGGGKALMLSVFGTSTGASVTFDELAPLVQKRFPDRYLALPYTSAVIRDKLNAEITDPEKKILSPEQMLEKLKTDGYTDIAVISTILFPGVEHEKLEAVVEEFASANKDITVSYTPPLLSRPEKLRAAVGVLGKYMIRDASNVVVAHGSHEGHEVEESYRELAGLVAAIFPDARVGSIEGVPDMEETLKWVEGRPQKDVRFIVFMFVAGDHAENDIASDEEDSLFSAVRKMGKTPSVLMVDTKNGKRIASLGLDPEYRKLLLDYYSASVPK